MSRYPRLRMQNCVSTVLEVNENLGMDRIRPEVIRQFERLMDFIGMFSEDLMDEGDIGRIEEATNQLLDEIRDTLEKLGINYHHEGPVN